MNNKKNNSLLLVFIIFLTSFLLGVLFSLRITNYFESNLLKNYYNIPEWNLREDLDLSKFWLSYDIVKNNYYDSQELNNQELIEWSVRWLIDWLWDRHSEYFNKEENKNFTESLSWDFEWIWAVVKEHFLWVEVDRIIKWSPAKKYDIRTGDIIISANWTLLEWLSSSEAVNHIKWEAGSKVVIELIRDNLFMKKEVYREKIKLPSVESEDLENNMWYISLNMFWEESSKEFEEVLYNFRKKDGIIIDLRDNWGGYLNSSVEILSHLVKRWEVLVTTKFKDWKRDELYKSINNWNLYEWKLVVLINENSASASEILAWALKDYSIAIVVWKDSYWKGSVQKPFELSDWSMIKLTIAKWFTPNWTSIDEEWISPDIEISFIEEDYINVYDRQKEESKKILKSFIEEWDINKTIEKYLEEQ